MIGWRVVQAVGACAGVVLARAMVRDLYEGERAAQMLSTLMTVMAIAPLLGPIVGGQILRLAGGGRSSGRWSASASPRSRRCSPCPRRCRPSGATASRWDGRSPAMASSCVSAGCSAMRAPAASSTAACSPTSPARPSPTSAITTSRRSCTACCSASGSSASWRANLINARLVMRLGSDAAAAGGHGRGGARGRTAGGRRPGPAGAALAGLVVPLFLFVSAAGFIVANSIAGALAELLRTRRCRLGPGRRDPLRQRYRRLRAGRRLRRWHAVADGLGDRARRNRQPALRTAARSGPRARNSERNRKSRMSFSRRSFLCRSKSAAIRPSIWRWARFSPPRRSFP